MACDLQDFALDVFDSLPGFVVVDREGNIAFIREQYANRLGTTREEATGRPVKEVISNNRLVDVLKQQKAEWGQHQRPLSGITGQYTADNICNRLLVRDRKDPEQIIGAMEFVAVHEYQDEEALISELDSLRSQNAMYRSHIAQMYQPEDNMGEILGRSEKVTGMKELIQRVADTAATVCISGETGTGKELVANAIHKLSRRREEPFIKINCAAIPKDLMESELFGYEAGAFTGAARQGKIGMFELANGGTLLLDEIGELPLDLQAKLLRVLQEREIKRIGGIREIPVDVRILCSTNRSLREMVKEGKFRADLYYRVNTMEVVVPPLRERMEDIPILADYFIRLANRQNGLAVSGMQPQIVRMLHGYSWPGNIRELEHSIERACILAGAGLLTEKHFEFFAEQKAPAEQPAPRESVRISYRAKQEKLEEESIIQALERCRGNRQRTAEMLNISRATLFRKMKKFGLL